MKGVARDMSLTIATLGLLACQGCEQVPELRMHAPVNRYETPRSIVPAGSQQPPLISTSSNFSFKQGQTTTTPDISIDPVLGQSSSSPFAFEFDASHRFDSLRSSNSPGVVDFETRRNIANILNPARSTRDFDAEVTFSAPDANTGLGFDVGVVPRMSLSKDGNFKQRSFGGEIRIGQNFDQRGKETEDDGSWYLFAAADGEALVYAPDEDRNFTNRMALRDQVTVGDLQAGVSLARGGGQLSLSYIRREVSYRDRVANGSENEDFAGVSFTIRR